MNLRRISISIATLAVFAAPVIAAGTAQAAEPGSTPVDGPPAFAAPVSYSPWGGRYEVIDGAVHFYETGTPVEAPAPA